MTGPLILATPEQLTELIREALRSEVGAFVGYAPKEVLTLKECAALLERHPKTVTSLSDTEGLPIHYISEREPRFLRSEVLEWLRSRAKPQKV